MVRKACSMSFEAVWCAMKSGKIHPGAGRLRGLASMAARYSCSSRRVVLFFFGECRASTQCAMAGFRARGEQPGACFVFAAADDGRSFEIELGKIRAGFPIVGSELDVARSNSARTFPARLAALRKLARSAFSP